MSTRSDIGLGFSPETGLALATYERMTGTLANAGYTPKGRPGGGIGAAHYGVSPIASVVMAHGASIPSEAGTVVAALEGLQARQTNALAVLPGLETGRLRAEDVIAPGTTLREYLENEIIAWVNPSQAMLHDLAEDQRLHGLWRLEFVPSAPFATLSGHKKGQGWYTVFFEAPGRPVTEKQTPFRRKAEMGLSILKVAGDLLRDTLSRQASTHPDPAPGSVGEGNTTPETTKATGTGIHSGLQVETPATPQTSSLHKRKSNASTAAEQSAVRERVRVSRACHRPHPEHARRLNHDPHWSGTAHAQG